MKNLARPDGAILVSRRNLLLSALVLGGGFIRNAVAQAYAVPQFSSEGTQFTIIEPRKNMPALRLFRLEGGTLGLQSLRGKPILLNFWASWCAACRKELPILDRLSQGPFRDKLHVLAVAEDQNGREVVEKFIHLLEIATLSIFLDPHGYAAHSDAANVKGAPFALYGMPITYAISASGSVVGYMPGAADWTDSSATKLIEYLLES